METINPQTKSPFMKLPAELRNQIYTYVFTPSECISGLIPSTGSSFGNLALLFTCRIIYSEAHILANSLTHSVTNRWHRTDLSELQRHYASLPKPLVRDCPLTRLELATSWRRYHRDPVTEKLEFFDSFTDFATFVWNVVELFETVSSIVIVHTLKVEVSARVRQCLRTDILMPESRKTGTRNAERSPGVWKWDCGDDRVVFLHEPVNWDIEDGGHVSSGDAALPDQSAIVLVGKHRREGRRVTVECPSEKEFQTVSRGDAGTVLGVQRHLSRNGMAGFNRALYSLTHS